MLGDEGLEALTIQRLASELGYAVGALYRYFKSKDALLVAVLHRVMDRFEFDFRESVGQADREATDLDDKERALLRVIVAGQIYIFLSQRRPREFSLVSTLMGDPRELLGTEDALPLFPAMMRLLGHLNRVFQDAQRCGALEDGEAASRTVVFWSTLQGILQLRKLGRFGVAALKFESLTPELMVALLRGWGAEPKQLEGLVERARKIIEAREAEMADTDAGSYPPEPSAPAPAPEES